MIEYKIKLLEKRIEQLILLQCRTLGITPSLTNQDTVAFATQLILEIEAERLKNGEPSLNSNGFPPALFPQEKKDFKDFSLLSYIFTILSYFKRKRVV